LEEIGQEINIDKLSENRPRDNALVQTDIENKFVGTFFWKVVDAITGGIME
jgi:hypothetical protein